MLFLIGLGLGDEQDITVKGLERIKSSQRVYLENYTSILQRSTEALEQNYGCKVVECDREMIESGYGTILAEALVSNVSLLVVGDPFGATTHSDLLIKCKKSKVQIEVIHNASIINAVGISGLQLYRFGQIISIPYFTPRWRPDSFYEKLKQNDELNLHTLCLLDIKIKEVSEENLFKGKKIFESPRFMTISEAIEQLQEVESTKTEGILNSDRQIVGLARVGSSTQKILYGKMHELKDIDFGPPLHCIIIPAKELHDIEAAVLEQVHSLG